LPTPPPAPKPPGTNVITNTILKITKGGNSNMALIIGIIVGALGFVAIGGFLVYYIIKRRRMESDRLAEEEDGDEDFAPVKKFQQKGKPSAANKRKIQ
jgi:H+/gluconate symporter-like permease